MVRIRVFMKFTNQPLKRTPVSLHLDTAPGAPIEGITDRGGVAVFDMPAASGKVVVAGAVRYQGRLDGDIDIALWSHTDADAVHDRGAPGVDGGSTAYPAMTTRTLDVRGQAVVTDSEGYLLDPADWSEEFVRAEAAREGLELSDEHWQVIRFLRNHYETYRLQVSVRDMLRHFRQVWGPDLASNRRLHDMFPRGGPQKQGNRLAGLLRVKGEH